MVEIFGMGCSGGIVFFVLYEVSFLKVVGFVSGDVILVVDG